MAASLHRQASVFGEIVDWTLAGSGLGLSIVRGIAHLHRAEIRLVPNPRERGTIARAIFPRPGRSPRRLRPAA